METNMRLENELYYRTDAGKEGAIRVSRDSQTNNIFLFIGKEKWPVAKLDLHIERASDGNVLRCDEKAFDGTLLVDDRGPADAPARIVVMDAERRLVVSSENDAFSGYLVIAAVMGNGPIRRSMTFAAIFSLKSKPMRSAVKWGKEPEWANFAEVVSYMLNQGEADGRFMDI